MTSSCLPSPAGRSPARTGIIFLLLLSAAFAAAIASACGDDDTTTHDFIGVTDAAPPRLGSSGNAPPAPPAR